MAAAPKGLVDLFLPAGHLLFRMILKKNLILLIPPLLLELPLLLAKMKWKPMQRINPFRMPSTK